MNLFCILFYVFDRLGIWLFMSGMPYGTLSSAMLWKIYHIMQRAETEDLDGLCSNLSIGPCTEVTGNVFLGNEEF